MADIKTALTEAKAKQDALLAYANNTTGVEDVSIGDAIKTLCDGFGGGGSELESFTFEYDVIEDIDCSTLVILLDGIGYISDAIAKYIGVRGAWKPKHALILVTEINSDNGLAKFSSARSISHIVTTSNITFTQHLGNFYYQDNINRATSIAPHQYIRLDFSANASHKNGIRVALFATRTASDPILPAGKYEIKFKILKNLPAE